MSNLASVRSALDQGHVVSLPLAGARAAAIRAEQPDALERLRDLVPGADGHHYIVGHVEQAQQLAADWSTDTQRLVDRCWPGPLTVLVRADDGDQMIEIAMASPRALQRLCRANGPWRIAALPPLTAAEFADRFPDVVVADERAPAGASPTLVDCTTTPLRVAREGALPASFIEATMVLAARRPRWRRSHP